MTAVDELIRGQKLLAYQMRRISYLFFAWLGVLLIQAFFPKFFVYEFMKWGGWESVMKFWPAFLIATSLAVVSSTLNNLPARLGLRFKIFGTDLMTSTLAGVWEELGYRYIYICYAMISISLINWILGTVFGWVFGVIVFIGGIALIADKKILPGLGTLAVSIFLMWYVSSADILYWIYENVLMFIIHYTTFMQMDTIFYSGYDKLFLFGAIAANALFRDGHKYQGPLGIINSWYMGMVLLFATITYGLLTAIVVHVIYDILVSFVYAINRQGK